MPDLLDDASDVPVVRHVQSRALTFVFTDLQDSVRLKEEYGDEQANRVLRQHRDHVRELSGSEGGRVVNWAGDGCFLIFETPSAAARFALRLQKAHADEPRLPSVRIGIHQGEVTEPDDLTELGGVEVDTAARIMNMARPGQVLLSVGALKSAKAHLRRSDTGQPVQWPVHGEYELKGLNEPLRIGEVGIEGLSPLTAPPGSVITWGRRKLTMVACLALAAGVLIPVLVSRPPTPMLAAVTIPATWGCSETTDTPNTDRPVRPSADDCLHLILEADRPGSFYVFQVLPGGVTVFQPPDPFDETGDCVPEAYDVAGKPQFFGTYRLDDEAGQYCFIALLTEQPFERMCEEIEWSLAGMLPDDQVAPRIRTAVEDAGFGSPVLGFATFRYTTYSSGD